MTEEVVEVLVDPLMAKVIKRITERCGEYGLDPSSLLMYVTDGYQPGGFMTAVLEDKLVEAAGHADDRNQRKLYQWAQVMYNDVPRDARGDRETVTRWMRHGGLRGLLAPKEPT